MYGECVVLDTKGGGTLHPLCVQKKHRPNNSHGSYGDFAPMQPGETYTVSIWVKTNKVNGGAVKIRFYTANNSEKGRITGAFRTVKASEGWKRIAWNFVDPPNSYSDSMSFYYADFKNPTKLWLCCPQLEHATNKKTPAPRPFSSASCLNKAGGEFNGGDKIDKGSKFLLGWKVNNPVTRVRRKAAEYGGIDAAEGKFYLALNAGCNLLRNVNLNTGWSQGYNKNIKVCTLSWPACLPACLYFCHV